MRNFVASSLLAFGLLGGAFAQAPSQAERSRSDSQMQNCEQMMAKMEERKAQMKAMNDQLRQKLQQMKTSQGEAKIDATAAVVDQLATQHLKMHNMMLSMNDERMAHMMGHMEDQAGMQQCPMMKGMGSTAKAEGSGGPQHDH